MGDVRERSRCNQPWSRPRSKSKHVLKCVTSPSPLPPPRAGNLLRAAASHKRTHSCIGASADMACLPAVALLNSELASFAGAVEDAVIVYTRVAPKIPPGTVFTWSLLLRRGKRGQRKGTRFFAESRPMHAPAALRAAHANFPAFFFCLKMGQG